ncbi:hypothetical protein [Lysobacter claricitrinus]|uniref:hypothetical protein n=1 Tax=Lysobacter claricitrinus TaxID=3367728 RepID=UPI0038B363B2
MLLLSACTGTDSSGAQPIQSVSPSPTAPHRPSADAAEAHAAPVESLAQFAKRIRVECTQKGGDLACIGGKPENGDIYDVDLRPDCGADGYFGGVMNDGGAELRDALPPNDASTPAVLGAGQLVCIQAVGSVGQDPSYFYVAMVPASDVAACQGNRLCSTYGDRKVSQWNGDATRCRIATNGRPTDACPQGWVRREDIEDFSNGM